MKKPKKSLKNKTFKKSFSKSVKKKVVKPKKIKVIKKIKKVRKVKKPVKRVKGHVKKAVVKKRPVKKGFFAALFGTGAAKPARRVVKHSKPKKLRKVKLKKIKKVKKLKPKKVKKIVNSKKLEKAEKLKKLKLEKVKKLKKELLKKPAKKLIKPVKLKKPIKAVKPVKPGKSAKLIKPVKPIVKPVAKLVKPVKKLEKPLPIVPVKKMKGAPFHKPQTLRKKKLSWRQRRDLKRAGKKSKLKSLKTSKAKPAPIVGSINGDKKLDVIARKKAAGAMKLAQLPKPKGKKDARLKEIQKATLSADKRLGVKEPKISYLRLGIPGFDALVKEGIPEGASVLVEGGPGSGKTIFCLELARNLCRQGKKVLYMSFEEPEYRLRSHLKNFGTDVAKFERSRKLYIKRFNALDIARSVEALLSEAKKELLIDVQPVLIPRDFEPDIVLVDSLTSIGSAFSGEESRFRIYMEQLFRYLESHQITSFLIRETSSPTHIGTSFVEKAEAVSFLSDGIIALYNVFLPDGLRKRAIEVVKMRGVHIERKIVECAIVGKKGFIVYPASPLKGVYKLT